MVMVMVMAMVMAMVMMMAMEIVMAMAMAMARVMMMDMGMVIVVYVSRVPVCLLGYVDNEISWHLLWNVYERHKVRMIGEKPQQHPRTAA